MIEIKKVSKKFGDKEVIKDLSLNIKDGEIFGFVGPNGAGKTTTINMMTGALDITEGEIFINGKSIEKEPVDAKKEFGIVPDSPDMFLNFKVIEYFNFIADIYDVDSETREEKIKTLCEKFKISKYLKDQIDSLSHGTRQKVIIIGALLHDPNIWILDEPMTGLDPESSFTLKEMMKEHTKQGKIVFFSSHVLEVVEKLCDRIAIINDGKILYLGTLKDLKSDYPKMSLEEIFLKLIKGKTNEKKD